MPATAADIPPELFDLILDSLNLNSYASEDYQRQIAHVGKHDLNMATLVCRHWAKLCQTKLFEEVSLSSSEDVSQLLELLKSTEGRVGSNIRSLYIPTSSLSDEGKTKPFLHLLPSLYPLIPTSLKTSIVFDGPLNTKHGSFRSLHRALPRTNPAFSTSLAHLHLNDLHLRNFIELMYAVGELPDMYRLVCTKVTWDALPAVIPVRRVAPANVLEEVLASGCTDNWTLVWLFVGYKRREALYLSQRDITTAGQLVKIVEAGIDQQQFARSEATIRGTVTSDFISVTVDYDLMFTGTEPEDGKYNAFATALTPSLHILCRRNTAINLGEISVVTLDFANQGPKHDATTRTDWNSFVENALVSHNLQKVVLGFQNKDRLVKFVEEIVDVAVAQDATRRVLKYAVRDKQGLYWKRLTAAHEIVEGRNIDLLHDVW